MQTRPLRDFTVPECQPFHFEGGKHGVLLLHGFTGTAAHMRPIGEGLRDRGFTVKAINLPGHAVSMDAMAKSGWQEWLDAAKDAFMALKAECDHVSVAGLSMGGCISLIIAEQMQPTSIATISAPMAVQQKLLPLACLIAPFLPHVMWRPRDNDPSPVIDRYDIGYPGFPTKCGVDLQHLIKMARRDLHAVQCPTLVVQSHADETITADSADIILAGLGSQRKGVLWLDDVPHACTISHEYERITAALAEHFRASEK